MGDAPRPEDVSPIKQAQAYAEGRSDDIARDVVAELLASHLALARAAEAMPSHNKVMTKMLRGILDSGAWQGAQNMLDLFAPIFARLTQERDEARAERDMASEAVRLNVGAAVGRAEVVELRQRAGGWQESAEQAHAAHGLLCRTLASLNLPSEPTKLENAIKEWRAKHLETHDALVRAAKERDELGQRAERAERERDAFKRYWTNECQSHRESGNRWVAQGAKLEAERDALRARIAELEASRGPGADVAHLLRLFREARTVAVVGPYNPHTEAEKVERGERDGIRAVIAHLAAMGEEAWPGDAAILEQAWPMVDCGAVTLECAVLDVVRSRLSPVLGALRAMVAELEAERAARFVNPFSGIPFFNPAPSAIGLNHAHELGSCSYCDGEGGGR